METLECDFLIVGAGSAGCVLAARLSEDSTCRVVLVEAGADFGADETPEIRNLYPLSYFDPRMQWPLHRAVWRRGGRTVPLPQGRGVGGSSSLMGMWALRGIPQDYDEWRDFGVEGWGWDEVLPCFVRLENDLDQPRHPLHGASGPVVIRRQSPQAWPPFTRAVSSAAVRSGQATRADINAEFGDGIYPVPISATHEGRVSSARAYLTPAVRQRQNLSILPATQCLRLLFDGRKATGALVEGPSGQRPIRTGRTVLTAGAMGSPTILFLSGIGPGDALGRLGLETRHHLPGVGRNLQNHVGVTIGGHLGGRVPSQPLDRSAAFVAIRASAAAGEHPDLYLSVLDRTSWTHFGGRIAAINAVLHKPRSVGHLRMERTREGLQTIADFDFLSDPTDAPRLAEAVVLASRLMLSEEVAGLVRRQGVLSLNGMLRRILRRTPSNRLLDGLAGQVARILPAVERRLVDSVMGPGPADLILALERKGPEALLPHVAGLFHLTGTCRMGPADDAAAVVSSGLRVHGVDCLYVVDASVMPSIPRANTNLPAMMIAERAAELLRP